MILNRLGKVIVSLPLLILNLKPLFAPLYESWSDILKVLPLKV